MCLEGKIKLKQAHTHITGRENVMFSLCPLCLTLISSKQPEPGFLDVYIDYWQIGETHKTRWRGENHGAYVSGRKQNDTNLVNL